MDISNKNEIIFSKGLVVVKDIDFNYIWNHKNMTRINKDIIWKYIHSYLILLNILILAYFLVDKKDFLHTSPRIPNFYLTLYLLN